MKLFELFGDIFIDDKSALKSIGDIDGKATSLGSKFGSVGKKIGVGMAVGTAAIGAAGTAMYGLAKKAADATDNIDKNSQKIGISRKAYQELDFVLSQNGASIDGMQTGMKTLSKAAYEASQGVTTYTDTFDALGVSVTDNNGGMKDQETLLYDTIRALQGMENETERTALASELLGKSATELSPLLNAGADSFDELTQKANELGLVMGNDAIDAGVAFTDTMDQLKRSFSTAFTTIGTQFMPLIQRFSEWIIENMPTIQQTFKTVFDVISKVVSVAFEWFDLYLFPIIEDVYNFINDNWDTIAKVFKTTFDIVGEVIEIAAGIIGDLFNIVKDVYNYTVNTFVKVKGVFEDVFQGISDAIESTVGWITDFYDSIVGAIDKFKEFIGIQDEEENKDRPSGGSSSVSEFTDEEIASKATAEGVDVGVAESMLAAEKRSIIQNNNITTAVTEEQVVDILNLNNQQLLFDMGVN